jgi:hypothetical protein
VVAFFFFVGVLSPKKKKRERGMVEEKPQHNTQHASWSLPLAEQFDREHSASD